MQKKSALSAYSLRKSVGKNNKMVRWFDGRTKKKSAKICVFSAQSAGKNDLMC